MYYSLCINPVGEKRYKMPSLPSNAFNKVNITESIYHMPLKKLKLHFWCEKVKILSFYTQHCYNVIS